MVVFNGRLNQPYRLLIYFATQSSGNPAQSGCGGDWRTSTCATHTIASVATAITYISFCFTMISCTMGLLSLLLVHSIRGPRGSRFADLSVQ